MFNTFYSVISMTVSYRYSAFVTPELKPCCVRLTSVVDPDEMTQPVLTVRTLLLCEILRDFLSYLTTAENSRKRSTKPLAKPRRPKKSIRVTQCREPWNHVIVPQTNNSYKIPVTRLPKPRYFQTFSGYEVWTSWTLRVLPQVALMVCLIGSCGLLLLVFRFWSIQPDTHRSFLPRQWKSN